MQLPLRKALAISTIARNIKIRISEQNPTSTLRPLTPRNIATTLTPELPRYLLGKLEDIYPVLTQEGGALHPPIIR
jgi:hypothetical protein